MKVYRVAVTGGRDHVITLEEARQFRGLLGDRWISSGATILLVRHGNALGVDQEAARIAEGSGYPSDPIPAPWGPLKKLLGEGDPRWKAAGHIRNWMLLQGADLLVAFEGGRGTANAVKQAGELGVEVVTLSWASGSGPAPARRTHT